MPEKIVTKGLVLRETQTKEADKILTALTVGEGMLSMKKVMICGLLALALLLSIDFCATFFGAEAPVLAAPALYILLFLACLRFGRSLSKRHVILIALTPVYLAALFAVVCVSVYPPLREYGSYSAAANTATDIFSDKKVMVIVPHEDDDLNLVSGMIDHYIKGGSEIFPVFVTNGDYYGIGERRIGEAIQCWGNLGVPEENVSFLGYGDQWSGDGPHIYNAAGDEPLVSAIGKTETYGIDTHPAYHNGTLYTYNHLREDLKSVILEKRPDVIFASDYDAHQDHKAVSLMTERVIGEILKEQGAYRPIVYKGYAYRTAWTADDDYYALNVLQTVLSDEEHGPMIYDWNDRVRFPVGASTLSRSIYESSLYDSLSIYASQGAVSRMARIANSDKVFWQRRTDSLLYDSGVEVSSGDGSYLNNFQILDTRDVRNGAWPPYDGVWTPASEDAIKSARISLKEKAEIIYLYIYDHPSEENNMTNLEIAFDDGTKIETGPLAPDGTATKIDVNKKNVESFELRVLSYEGDQPGIAEIEAFDKEKQDTEAFVKIQDANGNFAYDYIVEGEHSEYTLYSNHDIPALSEEHYSVSCDNDKCEVKIANGKIMLRCPGNEICTVTVEQKGTNLKDTVVFRNLSWGQKARIRLGQAIEPNYSDRMRIDPNRICIRLTSYRFLHEVKWACIRLLTR